MRRKTSRDLEVGLLRTFLAVVEHGNMRKAAESVNMTQPAVSARSSSNWSSRIASSHRLRIQRSNWLTKPSAIGLRSPPKTMNTRHHSASRKQSVTYWRPTSAWSA